MHGMNYNNLLDILFTLSQAFGQIAKILDHEVFVVQKLLVCH